MASTTRVRIWWSRHRAFSDGLFGVPERAAGEQKEAISAFFLLAVAIRLQRWTMLENDRRDRGSLLNQLNWLMVPRGGNRILSYPTESPSFFGS
jgi:hypothetical protein